MSAPARRHPLRTDRREKISVSDGETGRLFSALTVNNAKDLCFVPTISKYFQVFLAAIPTDSADGVEVLWPSSSFPLASPGSGGSDLEYLAASAASPSACF